MNGAVASISIAACVIAAFYFGHPLIALAIAFFGFCSIEFD